MLRSSVAWFVALSGAVSVMSFGVFQSSGVNVSTEGVTVTEAGIAEVTASSTERSGCVPRATV